MGEKILGDNTQYGLEDAGSLVAALVRISGVSEDNSQVGPLVGQWVASLPPGAVIEAGVDPGGGCWLESVPQPDQPAMIMTADSWGLHVVDVKNGQISHISAESGRLSAGLFRVDGED